MSFVANLKKTYYYAKKNGIAEAINAVQERAYAKKSPLYLGNHYEFQEVSDEELKNQKKLKFQKEFLISILVPTFETNPVFLKELLQSVVDQSYTKWELILADASNTSVVYDTLQAFIKEKNASLCQNQEDKMENPIVFTLKNENRGDSFIVYKKLASNDGISENTNEALKLATGDYIGLLDHDDLLTKDALFEMVKAICENSKISETAEESLTEDIAFLYSDEDKCNTELTHYYEPNIKLDFNFDYLLSNNYICHFLVMKTSLMKQLQFRAEYNGAQDFDLVLRAAIESLCHDAGKIIHVNKLLYHWRCHEGSTAVNPQSKLYAYEAGRRAVRDNLKNYLKKIGEDIIEDDQGTDDENFKANGIRIKVSHTKHNGFYRVEYGMGSAKEILMARKDVAAVCFSDKKRGKITSDIYNKEGECLYNGMPVKFSGYLHRASLQQDVYRVKNTAFIPRKEYEHLKERNEISIYDLTNKEKEFILYDPFLEEL